MKTSLRYLIFSLFALLVPSLCHAITVNITVSGGGGTPLSITLSSDITFTTTADALSSKCLFVFEDLNSSGTSAAFDFTSGTMTIGGVDYTKIKETTGMDLGTAISKYDFIIYSNYSGTISSGTTVTLHAGTYTTEDDFPLTLAGSGTYTVYLSDFGGNVIAVASVPESSDCAVFAGVLALGLVSIRKIAKKRAA